MPTQISLSSIAVSVFALFWTAQAHADYLSSWVAVSCNSKAGRAAVRFGYADADAPPLFAQAESVLDEGISALPIASPSQKEASCRLSDSREVKVRLGTGYGEGDQYSIWIDGVRVVHNSISQDNLPYEFLVYPKGFRLCAFQLRSNGSIYDVTSTDTLPPIKCGTTLTMISGEKDAVEYPSLPATKPQPESIVLSQGESQLCLPLVVRQPDVGAESFHVEVPNAMGAGINAQAWGDGPVYFPDDGHSTSHINSVSYDFWDTGHPVRVYEFDTGGTFTDEFVVVPGQDTPEQEVIRLAKASNGWESAREAARRKGWNVYTAAGTPYEGKGKVNIELTRIHNVSYLLYVASRGNDNPVAVLMKPRHDGQLTSVCVFNQVHAHF